MSLRRTLATAGIVLAAFFAANNSPAETHNGHSHPWLAQGAGYTAGDDGLAQFISTEAAPNFSETTFAVCSALALCSLGGIIAFFRKRELWYPAVAVLVTKLNGRIAHELYLALKNRQEQDAARAGKKGDTEFRRRRRKKTFAYADFYNKVVKELSLHSTCGPARRSHSRDTTQWQAGAAASHEGFELLARLEQQIKNINRRLSADAVFPQDQAEGERVYSISHPQ